jgi:hypothetical protein
MGSIVFNGTRVSAATNVSSKCSARLDMVRRNTTTFCAHNV